MKGFKAALVDRRRDFKRLSIHRVSLSRAVPRGRTDKKILFDANIKDGVLPARCALVRISTVYTVVIYVYRNNFTIIAVCVIEVSVLQMWDENDNGIKNLL